MEKSTRLPIRRSTSVRDFSWSVRNNSDKTWRKGDRSLSLRPTFMFLDSIKHKRDRSLAFFIKSGLSIDQVLSTSFYKEYSIEVGKEEFRLPYVTANESYHQLLARFLIQKLGKIQWHKNCFPSKERPKLIWKIRKF